MLYILKSSLPMVYENTFSFTLLQQATVPCINHTLNMTSEKSKKLQAFFFFFFLMEQGDFKSKPTLMCPSFYGVINLYRGKMSLNRKIETFGKQKAVLQDKTQDLDGLCHPSPKCVKVRQHFVTGANVFGPNSR